MFHVPDLPEWASPVSSPSQASSFSALLLLQTTGIIRSNQSTQRLRLSTLQLWEQNA